LTEIKKLPSSSGFAESDSWKTSARDKALELVGVSLKFDRGTITRIGAESRGLLLQTLILDCLAACKLLLSPVEGVAFVFDALQRATLAFNVGDHLVTHGGLCFPQRCPAVSARLGQYGLRQPRIVAALQRLICVSLKPPVSLARGAMTPRGLRLVAIDVRLGMRSGAMTASRHRMTLPPPRQEASV
jgi:hypothetical protein